ncbi:S8 family serine peptidase [Haloarchaeobius sp. FL176]|uniref:S8 family serine peptidase n=1 Tax=Haloarchaeobius sp. FL176 TaxID=2967129 RepID=UPI002147916A|nr:S8 family serine peptidase [Haloarchaeobius sp. FL176]
MADDTPRGTNRRTFLKTTGVAASAAAFAGLTQATPGREPGAKENELLVGISSSTSMASVQRKVERDLPSDANIVHENDNLGYIAVEVRSDGPSTMDAVSSRIERQSGVRYVEQNTTHHAFAQPNDPKFAQQYAPQQVRAPSAWDTTFGSEGVTVAIVDTGVDYTHPDLQSRFGSNKGSDFAGGDGDPIAPSGENHGTHVAGIASATTDNGTGVAGMSDSTLLACRALGGGSGSTADIADAVEYATDQGADIINMSLGGGGYTNTMKNAVSYAVNNGTLPICAAGNDGSSSVSYPAAYDECVAVSAVDSNENLANFSQYGPNLDVAAPGVDVLSTWNDSPYNKISGTSMACPAASGVAALGKAVEPGLNATQLRSKLKNTAVDIGLSEQEQGAGRVDALNIVGGGGDGNTAPTVSIDASSATVTVGQEVTFDGSGSSDADGSISSYEWSFGDGTTATGQTVAHTYSAAGDYSASLTVTDDDGATTTDSVAITVESEDGGGNCGDTSTGGSADSSLSGYWDSKSYTYTTSLDNPCQVTVSLTGPSNADFDLYVTLDGRTPTTSDYDKRSITQDSQEQVIADAVSAGQDIGILVDSYSGSGSYTVSVEEIGQ